MAKTNAPTQNMVDPISGAFGQQSQTPLGLIDTTTQQAVENSQVVGGQSGLAAAQKYISKNFGRRTPEGQLASPERQKAKSLASGLLASAQEQRAATEQAQANKNLAMQFKATSTKEGVQNLTASQAEAGAVQKTFAAQTAEDQKKNEADIAQMDTRGRELITDFETKIEEWATSNDSALVHQIQAANTAYILASKAEGRAVAEQYGKNSQEFEDFSANRRITLQSQASDLIGRSWEITQGMLAQGAAGLSTIASSVAQNLSWGTKYAIDSRQQGAMAVQQAGLDTQAYISSLESLKGSRYDDFAQWIDSSTVPAYDASPLLLALADLDSTIAAEEKLAAEEAEANKPKANPYARNYGKV